MIGLRKALSAFVVAVIMAFACPAAQAALYSGAWEPTDNNVNYISTDFASGSNHYVYMYKWNTPEDNFLILPKGSVASTVEFSHDGGGWKASSGGYDLNLGANPYFGLILADFFPKLAIAYSYDVSKLKDVMHLLTVDGAKYLQVDASMVPIPSSVWLLGSGLLSFVLLRNRQKKISLD